MINANYPGLDGLQAPTTNQKPEEPPKYCLYARKSTESEERQVLSIDSQVKEMLDLAVKENLNVVEIKRESHSAKETGQRQVFNELIGDIRQGKLMPSLLGRLIASAETLVTLALLST